MEKEVSSLRRLVGLLRELPAHRPPAKQKRKAPHKERSDVRAPVDRNETRNRSKTCETESGSKRAKGGGRRARRDGPHGAELDEGVEGTSEKGGAARVQQGADPAGPLGGGKGVEKARQKGRVAIDRAGARERRGANAASAESAETLQSKIEATEKDKDHE